MKHYIAFLVFLLSLSAFGQGLNVSWSRFTPFLGNACADSPSPYLAWQGFECSPFDHGPEAWTTNGGGVNYIGTALAGLKSLHITNNGAADGNLVSPTFSGQSEVWAFFLFKPIVILPSSAGRDIIAGWQRSDHNLQAYLAINTSGTLRIASSTIDNTVDSMSAGTLYYVWFHYKRSTGANGVLDVGFSTNGTRPTSGNKFVQITGQSAADNLTEFTIMQNTGNPMTSEYQFDNVLVKTSQIGDNPP